MPDQIPSRSSPLLRQLGWGVLPAVLIMSAAILSGPVGATELAPAIAHEVRMPTPASRGPGRYFKTLDAEGQYRITADFRGFSGASLSISFLMEQAVSRSSMKEFGISADEIDAMRGACQRSGECNQAEFDQRLTQYFRNHKLRLRAVPGQRSHLFVDIPEVVRRNQAYVRPVAAALKQLGAEQGQDDRWIFETAVALVQAGLEYRTPSTLDRGRQTLGFYTPPRALESGYGDCDTKSALLAAILLNLGDTRIIGVRVPGHYLLGIAREPLAGEAFVQYRGESYVLVEAAGPAVRRPGDVAERTRLALSRGDDIRIDPMF